MPENSWLSYVTAFGSIATPVLVLVLTAIGWRIRSKFERYVALEDKLREDRIKSYDAILEPFVILLTSDGAWQSDPKNKTKDKNETAGRILMSLQYRRHGFLMSLVGSDSVVKAYNELMQFSFQGMKGPGGSPDTKKMLSLLGQFLLEIRRSMGNETTTLNNWDMLEWIMTDIRRIRD